MIAFTSKANRPQVLLAAGMAVALIAIADRAVGTRASLGLLYIIPMAIGASVLARWQTAGLALACSALRAWFDLPHPRALELLFRSLFSFLAYTGLGLFMTTLIRNREVAMRHLAEMRQEQGLRREAEEQLKVLAASSPAAILTIDCAGIVLAANEAADALFSIPPAQSLKGRPIGAYLPVLADALQYQSGLQGLRTEAQCQGRRENGELFLAHTWFSSYNATGGRRLAAIVVDSSEEMRDREEESLQQLMIGNRIATAAVSHEVRNLCSAIALVCSNLTDVHGLGRDEDFQRLINLVEGLERIASMDLRSRTEEALEQIPLQEVLDDLRIVIEPDWREINGSVCWNLPSSVPAVVAERHGLLQAFLNLAQNSHRAVQDSPVRELIIAVSVEGETARICFRDTGPGIAVPDRLFEPFQPGSDGTGLGLYVSRALVRSYGGELQFVPQLAGSCFTVEVQVA